MDKRPERERVSAPEKDALMLALWAEVQRLQTRLAVREATSHEPRKDAHHSRVPPSHTLQPNRAPGPRTGTRREASVGRAGGGRPLHPDPDPVLMAQATTCPHGGGTVQAHEPHPQAVDDKLEVPPIQPIVTRVEPYAGPCPHGGPSSVAQVPVGMEPGTPFGTSLQSLATDVRYPQAMSDERRAALCPPVCGLDRSAGARATLCPRVKPRLDPRVAAILTRLRSRRWLGRDDTSARVNGPQPWEWVFQNAPVCRHVIRPRRGQGVIQDVLGAHRPTIWVAALYRAPQQHPAEDWQVCLAHPWRDCPVALEAGEAVFAPRLQRVFLRAWAIHTRRDTLAASTRYPYRCDRSRRVDRC